MKAARVQDTGCTPDPTAIAWLLLEKTETSGSGVFSKITYIQRTNTTGGLAPVEPGALNELREVPYTAEYYFYRAEDQASNRHYRVLKRQKSVAGPNGDVFF